MKTARQEADKAKGDGSTPVARDAKGREIISPEEKARMDEKAHKMAVEVRMHPHHGPVAVDQDTLCRKLQRRSNAMSFLASEVTVSVTTICA